MSYKFLHNKLYNKQQFNKYNRAVFLMNINDISDLITIEELCEWLLIGRNAAYTLLHSGEIKAFKIGRSWKISGHAVEEYIRRKSGL